mmetsp:Transcript_33611/g.103747  ORF Transcript_33611/g.103747 Transcript_33611/m.103747 type:complete len:500 (+) Transcript_33611:248-1747(+)
MRLRWVARGRWLRHRLGLPRNHLPAVDEHDRACRLVERTRTGRDDGRPRYDVVQQACSEGRLVPERGAQEVHVGRQRVAFHRRRLHRERKGRRRNRVDTCVPAVCVDDEHLIPGAQPVSLESARVLLLEDELGQRRRRASKRDGGDDGGVVAVVVLRRVLVPLPGRVVQHRRGTLHSLPLDIFALPPRRRALTALRHRQRQHAVRLLGWRAHGAHLGLLQPLVRAHQDVVDLLENVEANNGPGRERERVGDIRPFARREQKVLHHRQILVAAALLEQLHRGRTVVSVEVATGHERQSVGPANQRLVLVRAPAHRVEARVRVQHREVVPVDVVIDEDDLCTRWRLVEELRDGQRPAHERDERRLVEPRAVVLHQERLGLGVRVERLHPAPDVGLLQAHHVGHLLPQRPDEVGDAHRVGDAEVAVEHLLGVIPAHEGVVVAECLEVRGHDAVRGGARGWCRVRWGGRRSACGAGAGVVVDADRGQVVLQPLDVRRAQDVLR